MFSVTLCESDLEKGSGPRYFRVACLPYLGSMRARTIPVPTMSRHSTVFMWSVDLWQNMLVLNSFVGLVVMSQPLSTSGGD